MRTQQPTNQQYTKNFFLYFACALFLSFRILRSAIDFFYVRVIKFERTNGTLYHARYSLLKARLTTAEINEAETALPFLYFLFSFAVAPLSPLKMADYRLASLEGLNHVCSKKIDWPTATIHITENPISEAVVC